MRKPETTQRSAVRVDDIVLDYHDASACGRVQRRCVCWEYDPERSIWQVVIRDRDTGRLLGPQEHRL